VTTIVGAAVLIAAAGYLAVSTLGGSDSMAEAGLPPTPAEAAAEWTPTPEEQAEAIAAARAGAEVRRQAKADPSSIPPASAGSNGSYEPPPPGERRRINARTHTPEGTDADESSILLGGTAIAPPGAPELVQDFVSAANSIVGQPYVWGGGHESFRSRGYDCSGAVSYALAGAGLLGAPATSGQLMGWGEPGRGAG
jgi:cell wall-associated NlpC family hydrolase